MSDRVRQTDAAGPARDCSTVKHLQRLRSSAGRILGDIHDWQAVPHRVTDRLFGRGNDAVHCPILCILADRRGPDEGCGFDLDPKLIGNADDRLDIGDDGPGSAIRRDGQLLIPDLLRQRAHLVHHAGAGAGQADVGGHDAEIRHQVQ